MSDQGSETSGDQSGGTIRPQPLISVADVQASSRWYQELLSLDSGHGGEEYDRIEAAGELILQIHKNDVGHGHGPIGDPARPVGNGMIVWFEVPGFEAAAVRARQLATELVHDTQRNPNSGNLEIWLRDLDGYLVVLSSRG